MSASSKRLENTARSGLWLITLGDALQLAGSHFLTVAVSSYAYALAGSPWGFAMQQLVNFLPWVLFSNLAGPLVDRLDKRRVMIGAGLLKGLVCFGYSRCTTLDGILVLNFMNSLGSVGLITARTALIPALCGKDQLLRVNGLRAAAFGAVDLLIPTFAGAFVSRTGSMPSFTIAAGTFLVGVIGFAFVREPKATMTAPGSVGGLSRGLATLSDDMKSAYRFIVGRRDLLWAMALYVLYMGAQGGVNAVYYPFVEGVLKAGPDFFGLSVSVYFGANLVAGFMLARFGAAIRRWPMIRLVALAPMVWVGYSFLHLPFWVLVLGAVEGLAMSFLNNLFMTKVQEESPREMTGRVWGLIMSISSASEVTGILVVGALAGRLGIAPTYRTMGILVGAVVVLLSIWKGRHHR